MKYDSYLPYAESGVMSYSSIVSLAKIWTKAFLEVLCTLNTICANLVYKNTETWMHIFKIRFIKPILIYKWSVSAELADAK